jgi:hypothetical protein
MYIANVDPVSRGFGRTSLHATNHVACAQLISAPGRICVMYGTPQSIVRRNVWYAAIFVRRNLDNKIMASISMYDRHMSLAESAYRIMLSNKSSAYYSEVKSCVPMIFTSFQAWLPTAMGIGRTQQPTIITAASLWS